MIPASNREAAVTKTKTKTSLLPPDSRLCCIHLHLSFGNKYNSQRPISHSNVKLCITAATEIGTESAL